jgi:16S rRNA (adenine1518-N6/adenine1519-N6)-dimethyltransferase
VPPEGDAPARRDALPPTRKSLGQHFLTDRRVLARIAESLALRGDETVLEIGPGRGALTDLLVERAGRLVAIEYDRALAALLRERYVDRPEIEIVQADVLDVALGELADGPYVLVGNVPYYITTPILFHALAPPRAERAVYLVQREVAERLVAPPGGKDYGALTVNVAALARAEILFGVAARAFLPPPKVESAVVRITPLAEPEVGPDEERRFRTLVQSIFGMRRKQMRRIVRTAFALSPEQADVLLRDAGIEPDARPEVLGVGRFVALMRAAARSAGER